MSKWDKDKQKPEDEKDKDKKRVKKNNKNLILDPQAILEGLNQVIQLIKFLHTL